MRPISRTGPHRPAARQWLITHLFPRRIVTPVTDEDSCYEPEETRNLTMEEFEERMKLAEVNAR